MKKKRKTKSNEDADFYISKQAVHKIVEGLTELLMGMITGNDNTEKEKTNETTDRNATNITM